MDEYEPIHDEQDIEPAREYVPAEQAWQSKILPEEDDQEPSDEERVSVICVDP